MGSPVTPYGPWITPTQQQVDGGNGQDILAGAGVDVGSFAGASPTGGLGTGPMIRAPRDTDVIKIGLGATTKPEGPLLQPTMKYAEAVGLPAYWYANDPKMYKKFVTQAILYKYPGADADMGLRGAMSIWDDLLQTSIAISNSSNGQQQMSPWDILETYDNQKGDLGTRKVGDWLVDNATGEKVKYVGPKTKTTTDVNRVLSSAEDVQAIANQALAQLLGRAPSAKELAQFRSTLNQEEQANPTVTTSTVTLNDMGEEVSRSSTTTGGVSAAAKSGLIESGVKETKEYGKYQAGTTYFNTLLQMVGGM